MLLFWEKVQAGRIWRVRRLATGAVLGFVQHSFDVWDAYVCTGKKWPDDRRCVNISARKKGFWAARRAVEHAIGWRWYGYEAVAAKIIDPLARAVLYGKIDNQCSTPEEMWAMLEQWSIICEQVEGGEC